MSRCAEGVEEQKEKTVGYKYLSSQVTWDGSQVSSKWLGLGLSHGLLSPKTSTCTSNLLLMYYWHLWHWPQLTSRRNFYYDPKFMTTGEALPPTTSTRNDECDVTVFYKTQRGFRIFIDETPMILNPTWHLFSSDAAQAPPIVRSCQRSNVLEPDGQAALSERSIRSESPIEPQALQL